MFLQHRRKSFLSQIFPWLYSDNLNAKPNNSAPFYAKDSFSIINLNDSHAVGDANFDKRWIQNNTDGTTSISEGSITMTSPTSATQKITDNNLVSFTRSGDFAVKIDYDTSIDGTGTNGVTLHVTVNGTTYYIQRTYNSGHKIMWGSPESGSSSILAGDLLTGTFELSRVGTTLSAKIGTTTYKSWTSVSGDLTAAWYNISTNGGASEISCDFSSFELNDNSNGDGTGDDIALPSLFDWRGDCRWVASGDGSFDLTSKNISITLPDPGAAASSRTFKSLLVTSDDFTFNATLSNVTIPPSANQQRSAWIYVKEVGTGKLYYAGILHSTGLAGNEGNYIYMDGVNTFAGNTNTSATPEISRSGSTLTVTSGTVSDTATVSGDLEFYVSATVYDIDITMNYDNIKILDSSGDDILLYPAQPNLQNYWRMDSGATSVTDIISSNSLTNNGSVSFANTGIISKCATFSSSNYLQAASDVSSNATTLMISCWINADSVGSDQIILDETTSFSAFDTRLRLLLKSNSELYMAMRDIQQGTLYNSSSSNTVSAGTWYHILAYFDTTNDKQIMYVNGVMWINESVTMGSFNFSPASVSLRVGQGAGAQSPFSGKLDELAITVDATITEQQLGAYALYLWNKGNGAGYLLV
jgi:hypothetical protein